MSPPLEELRVDRGMSVPDLAKAAGVSAYVIRRAEATGSRPRPENALKLARYFGLRVTDVWPIENGNGNDDEGVPA